MNIVGVILAAGRSARMKRGNKLLLDYGGHTVIEQTFFNLLHSHVESLLVITGYEKARLEAIFQPHKTERVKLVHNENWTVGRGSSIRCAVKSVQADTEAILFMPGDKPTVDSNLINRAIEQFERTRPPVLYVRSLLGRGHPIIFDRSLFGELTNLEGDIVGEALVKKYKERTVELFDDRIQPDLDTDEDYEKLLKDPARYNH